MSSAAIPVSLRSSVIQRKMDLFNSLPENGTDHLQQEIADQLTRDKEPVDGKANLAMWLVSDRVVAS